MNIDKRIISFFLLIIAFLQSINASAQIKFVEGLIRPMHEQIEKGVSIYFELNIFNKSEYVCNILTNVPILKSELIILDMGKRRWKSNSLSSFIENTFFSLPPKTSTKLYFNIDNFGIRDCEYCGYFTLPPNYYTLFINIPFIITRNGNVLSDTLHLMTNFRVIPSNVTDESILNELNSIMKINSIEIKCENANILYKINEKRFKSIIKLINDNPRSPILIRLYELAISGASVKQDTLRERYYLKLIKECVERFPDEISAGEQIKRIWLDDRLNTEDNIVYLRKYLEKYPNTLTSQIISKSLKLRLKKDN